MRNLMILLLCVGTCLAATAATADKPRLMKQLNPTIISKLSPSRQKVSMPNKMNVHFNVGDNNPSGNDFISGAKKSLQSQRINQENLVNKRAPRRLSDQEIIDKPYVCFLYAYDYDEENGTWVPGDPYYAGCGAYWYPDCSEGLYFAGFYWNEENSTYYLPLEIDYVSGEVALPWGILLRDDSTTSSSRNRVDTIWFEMLVSEAYWENDEQIDCKGTLYQDGSIIFDDNYVYYYYREEQTYRNGQLTNTEYFETFRKYVGTQILAANGELTFNYEQNGDADSSPVFMYQEDENVYVGNMWYYGVPNAMFVLKSDNTFNYPCSYEEDGVTYVYNPIWDVDDTWIEGGLGEFYPVSDYTLDGNGYIDSIVWGINGVATPDQLSWDYTMPSNGYHFLYGYENNVLRWINGGHFIIPTDCLPGDVDDDGIVTMADLQALTTALLNDNFDDSINSDNADCNKDGTITIDDIAALTDYLNNQVLPE